MIFDLEHDILWAYRSTASGFLGYFHVCMQRLDRSTVTTSIFELQGINCMTYSTYTLHPEILPCRKFGASACAQ